MRVSSRMWLASWWSDSLLTSALLVPSALLVRRACDRLCLAVDRVRPAVGPYSESNCFERLSGTYCVVVLDGDLDMDVSDGGVVLPFVVVDGLEGVVVVLELFVDLSFFKTSSTLRPPAFTSSPIPCIVLHPAMHAMAAAAIANR